MTDVVAFFRKRFRAAGNAKRAVSEKAYMKSALSFHGVDQKTVRDAAREFGKVEHEDLRNVVDALYASEWFDLHSAAVAVLERNVRVLTSKDLPWLIDLVRASACWAHVDWLATKTVGPLEPDAKTLRAWARDPDFWVRRTALLALLEELRAGGGDFDLFAELAEPMLAEKEFFIRKAIGWILRETSRKRPALVAKFLRQHRESASGLTLREGAKYLPARDRAALGLASR